MRGSPVWTILILTIALVSSASAREWVASPATAPAWDIEIDQVCGCSNAELLGYGAAGDWADEIQVCFRLPEPARGGPWLIEYVAFYMAGSGDHEVILRYGDDFDGEPSELLSAPGEYPFTPLQETWPPTDWTYVNLHQGGAPCDEGLLRMGGELAFVGIQLGAGDVIGLGAPEADIRGWGLSTGVWVDDTAVNNLVPAVRLGLTDMGTSNAQESTWGLIKDLFK